MKVREDLVNIFFPDFLLNHIQDKQIAVETNVSNEGTCSSDNNCFSHVCAHSSKCDICSVTKQNIKSNDIEFLLSAHQAVTRSGLYNFEGCRIPLHTKLNIQYLRSMNLIIKITEFVTFWNLVSL